MGLSVRRDRLLARITRHKPVDRPIRGWTIPSWRGLTELDCPFGEIQYRKQLRESWPKNFERRLDFTNFDFKPTVTSPSEQRLETHRSCGCSRLDHKVPKQRRAVQRRRCISTVCPRSWEEHKSLCSVCSTGIQVVSSRHRL